MWLVLVVFSAISLGIYNVFQKISLNGNAVIPVLFSSMVGAAILLTPFKLISIYAPEYLVSTIFYVPSVDLHTHGLIFIKAAIICCAWVFAYAAMKHLPLTIISPIKASQPIWTVLGAVLIFSERLNTIQIVGVVITLLFFYGFSVIGKKEGFSFRNNKWIWFMIISILFGATSGLYDKYLMRQYDRMAIQVFFTYYQVVIMSVVMLTLWYPQRKKSTPFTWRWAIMLISVFILVTDFLYFYALSMPDSLLAIISPLRRTGMLVPFVFGAVFYKEKNLKWKFVCLIGLLVGVYFLFLGSW